MSEHQPNKTTAEIMAALVAQRKAAARGGPPGAKAGKHSERAAAALSASKSKPAMRK